MSLSTSLLLPSKSAPPIIRAGQDCESTHRRFLRALHKGELHFPSLKMFLLSGVSPNITNRFDQTALHIAAIRGATMVVSFLISMHAFLDLPDVQGFTPLHYAAAHNQSAIVNMLIQAGATVDVFNFQGHTPLHVANEHAVAKLLIEGGADVDLQTMNEGETALHKAARAGDGRLVLLLLAEGAEVGIMGRDGSTPMHEAAKRCDTKTLRALIRFGARIDVADKLGFTPTANLQWRTSREGHVEMLKLFWTAGAWR